MSASANATPRPAHAVPAERRTHGAAVARRLLAGPASAAAAALDWDSLVHAPAWLGWTEAEMAWFARRAGALLAWPAPGLWIDAARLAAARAAVGADWWRLLLRHDARPLVAAPQPLPAEAGPQAEAPGGAPLDPGLGLWTQSARLAPAEVGPAFQAAGAALLLASLPHGALRHGAGLMLQPWLDAAEAALQASPLPTLPTPWADSVVQQCLQLQQQIALASAEDPA
jgi:hypothetical protein